MSLQVSCDAVSCVSSSSHFDTFTNILFTLETQTRKLVTMVMFKEIQHLANQSSHFQKVIF